MSLTDQGKSDSISHKLLEIELSLSLNLRGLTFSKPVSYIYNPLEYAYDMHSNFVKKFCNTTKHVLFLGMNPGPWGMSQTGVPFGEVKMVKEWLQITGNVNKPEKEHPSRQILGLACKRSEVSGKKFWGLFQHLCKDPESFFQQAFVYNYCPLAFMTDSGKNITPAEMKASERRAMNDMCDEALRNVLELLQVKLIVAIGRFAESRAKLAIANTHLSCSVNGLKTCISGEISLSNFLVKYNTLSTMHIERDRENKNHCQEMFPNIIHFWENIKSLNDN